MKRYILYFIRVFPSAFVAALVICFVACFVLTGCSGGEHPDAYGYFEATEWLISAESNGRILAFSPREGDPVAKGEQVGTIDTMQWHLQKRHLELQREALKETMPDAVRQLAVLHESRKALANERERIAFLVDAGSANRTKQEALDDEITVCDRQIQAVVADLKRESAAVLAQLEALDMQWNLVEDQLRKCAIVSPEEGIVQQIYVKEHEFASVGRPLFKLSGRRQMIFNAWFRGDQLARLATNKTIQVGIDIPGNRMSYYTGVIQYVSDAPAFAPNKVQTRSNRTQQLYHVKISIENDGRLSPGMPGEAYWERNEKQHD